MTENVQTLQSNLAEIKEDWPESSLDEKQNYVLELSELQVDAAEIPSVSGAELANEAGRLRDHIEDEVWAALQKREADSRREEQKQPGESP
jgi:hypothetical protein